MSSLLLAGVAEVEITPPVGTPLAGSLVPRPSRGTLDPLYVKAMVLESGGERMAYAIFDLVVLDGAIGAQRVAAASRATGIPPENMVWSCAPAVRRRSGCNVSAHHPYSLDWLYDGPWGGNAP